MTQLRAHLVRLPVCREVINSLAALRVEENTQRIEALLERLLDFERLKALEIPRWPVRPHPQGLGLSHVLLRAEYRLVPFVGAGPRETLDELLEWARGLQAGNACGLRFYTGPGGAGKTRLLIEAGETLLDEGWRVGFLPEGGVNADNARYLIEDSVPTLWVLDYVATRSQEVEAMLEAMAGDRAGRQAPVALVLLERAHLAELEQQLLNPTDPALVGMPELLALETIEGAPRTLAALGADEQAVLFDAAHNGFRRALEGADPPEHIQIPPKLPQRPLYVLLLALLASGQELPADTQNEEGLLRAVWEREKRNWTRRLKAQGLEDAYINDADCLNGILARIEAAQIAATLGFPFSGEDALRAFWERLTKLPRTSSGQRPTDEWLAARVIDLFEPEDEGPVPPLAPDPLADYVLAQRFAREPALVRAALPDVSQIEVAPESAAAWFWIALQVLQRRWGRDAESTVQAREWLANAERHLEEVGSSANDEATRTFSAMLESTLPNPERTLALREVVVQMRRIRADSLPENDPERVSALGNYGTALSALGRREEALKASQEAVDLYRSLADQNPQAFLPDLAMSLNNLGNRFSNLGRREEALKASQDAVDLYRTLADQNPQAFLPDLASSLNNVGAMFSNLGRREEALKASQEAGDLYRSLADQNPQAYLPDLATSLNNLGQMFSNLGRREEALKASQEAVDLYRSLAEQNPQAFLPDLAMSLNNLGNRFSNLGRREEALKASQEAVDIRRTFADQNPQAFLPDLAMSLNNVGAMLSDLGRREEALKASQEAVDIRRTFADQNPQAFLPDLAMSLNNLGNRFSNLGRREEALKASQEAVDIRRMLADQNPQAFLPDLAMSLGAHGSALRGAERIAEAATAFEEGVRALFEPARQLPQAFSELLGNLLREYVAACQATAQTPDAALVEAVGEVLGEDTAEAGA